MGLAGSKKIVQAVFTMQVILFPRDKLHNRVVELASLQSLGQLLTISESML